MKLIHYHPEDLVIAIGYQDGHLNLGLGNFTLSLPLFWRIEFSSGFRLFGNDYFAAVGVHPLVSIGTVVNSCGCWRIALGPFYIKCGPDHPIEMEESPEAIAEVGTPYLQAISEAAAQAPVEVVTEIGTASEDQFKSYKDFQKHATKARRK